MALASRFFNTFKVHVSKYQQLKLDAMNETNNKINISKKKAKLLAAKTIETKRLNDVVYGNNDGNEEASEERAYILSLGETKWNALKWSERLESLNGETFSLFVFFSFLYAFFSF